MFLTGARWRRLSAIASSEATPFFSNLRHTNAVTHGDLNKEPASDDQSGNINILDSLQN